MGVIQHNNAGSGLVCVDGSSVPVTVTGTTAEVEVGRIKLPPYPVGTSGAFRWHAAISCTNNANAKNISFRLDSIAGLTVMTMPYPSVGFSLAGWWAVVRDTGFYAPAYLTLTGGSAVAPAFRVADWTTPTDIVITVQLGVGTDSFTLHGWTFEGIRF